MLRRLVRKTLALAAASILFLLTIELLLSLWPGLLPPRLANHAFSKYGSFPGGIYFVDASDLKNGHHFDPTNLPTLASRLERKLRPRRPVSQARTARALVREEHSR